MRTIAVIPARMGSSRFPGKPLARLRGRPMLEHVFRRTAACEALDDVIVATCDDEIATVARAFGARVAMTSSAHDRASDRAAEAVAGDAAEIVVMVQGDEPMIAATMIEAARQPLMDTPSIGCVNLMAVIASEEELLDPNTIKVVTDAAGDAMYFSRLPIPAPGRRPFQVGGWYKQVCVIAFRREALTGFTALPPGPLERAESVDMLRFLEHGIRVRMVLTDVRTHAVDTRDDLAVVEALMSESSSSS